MLKHLMKFYNYILPKIITIIHFIPYILMLFSIYTIIKKNLYSHSFVFIKQNSFFLIAIVIISILLFQIPINFWKKNSSILLYANIVLFLTMASLYLFKVNTKKWNYIFTEKLQLLEITKLLFFMYLSSHLSKKNIITPNSTRISIKPIIALTLLSFIFFLQKDIKTIFILFFTTICLIFPFRINITTLLFISFSFILTNFIYYYPQKFLLITSILSIIHSCCLIAMHKTSLLQLMPPHHLYHMASITLQKFLYSFSILKNIILLYIFFINDKNIEHCSFFFLTCISLFISFFAAHIANKPIEKNQTFYKFFSLSCSIWFLLQAMFNIFDAYNNNKIINSTLSFFNYEKTNLIVIWIVIILLIKINLKLQKKEIQAISNK